MSGLLIKNYLPTKKRLHKKSFWRDNRLKSDEGKLNKFNLVVDALNYMGKDGWVFVSAFPVNTGSTQVYHYGFKKSF